MWSKCGIDDLVTGVKVYYRCRMNKKYNFIISKLLLSHNSEI